MNLQAPLIRHSWLGDSPFLKALRIDEGPIGILGSFFLDGETAARERGVLLSFASAEELVAANEANRRNWRPLLSLFDHRNGCVNDRNFVCVVGRNEQGDVVACHAARYLQWENTSFHDEATSLRLSYADPERMKRDGERCVISAQSTRTVRGRVVFSGALWLRPDYRGMSLHTIIPRIGKACAVARWKLDWIVSVMAEDVFRRGLAPRFGYTNVDWSVQFINSAVGDLRVAFLSMQYQDAINYIRGFSSRHLAQIDVGIRKRRA
jgi:hypothetical protein